MEKVGGLSARDISGEIMARLGQKFVFRTSEKPPPAKFATSKLGSRAIGDVSDFVTKRRDAYAKEYNTREIYKRQLSLRPVDDSNVPHIRLHSTQKERPLSEFTLKNDWKKRNWEVKPIEKEAAPLNSPKSNKITKDDAEFGKPTQNPELKKRMNDSREKIRDGSSIKTKPELLKLEKLPPIRSDKADTTKTDRQTSKEGKIKRCEQDKTFDSRTPTRQRKRSPSPDLRNITWTSGLYTKSELSEPGWCSRTLDKRFLEQAAKELLGLEEMVRQLSTSIRFEHSDLCLQCAELVYVTA